MKDKKIEQFTKILDKLAFPINLKESIISRLFLMEEEELDKFIYILPILQTSNSRKNLESKLAIYCNNMEEAMEEETEKGKSEDILVKI